MILGNPPYSGHSSNRGEWILRLIEGYKQVDGKPLGEKNPKWLQDDYVKFLRFAQWKIEQASEGIVGMITNHSYLDNPTFRGMRHAPTPEEDQLWQRLRNRALLGFKFRRQHPIDRFIVDFYCSEAGLVVEVEGPIHQYTQGEDAIRQEFLESLGLHVLHLTNGEINRSLDVAIKKIADALSPRERTLTPEDVFHYIYAVLYAPTYREKYAEFLKIDFPRTPFTSNEKLFRELAALGKRLVDLHLLRAEELDRPIACFQGEGDNRVAKSKSQGFHYDLKEERVYINKIQYFEPVPQEAWEYQIGGYQVLEKWLKDRKERQLRLDEIKTYCRIVTALHRTIVIQEEIDALYPKVEERIVEIQGN